MRLAKGIWLLTLLVLLAIGLATLWLMNASYDQLIQFTIDQLQRPDLQALLEKKYFTEAKFHSIQRAGLSMIFIFAGAGGFLIIRRKQFIRAVHALLSAIKKGIQSLIIEIKTSTRPVQIMLALLLSFVLLRSIYYAYAMYPQYDECWNYNYFLSNSFFTTFFAYNNYPLHNIISFLFLSILPDNTFCMRLPNIIIGLATITLLFVLAKKIFRHESLALAVAVIFSVLPTVFFYLLFARGVMLALFFAVLLAFFFFVKKTNTWRTTDKVLVILFTALGCYSMISFPIFIACFFSVYLLSSLIQKDITAAKNILATGFCGALLTLLLYTPILLGSGVRIAMQSAYLSGTRRINSLLTNANYLSLDQIGFLYGVYIFIFINLVLLFINKKKRLITLNILLLLLPYILFIVGDTHLPARALGFQALAYILTIALVLHYFRNSKMVRTIATSILFVVGNYICATHTFFTWSMRKDQAAYKIAEALQAKECDQVYDQSGNFSYFLPSILYHYKLKKQKITLYTINKNSARYLPPEKYKGPVFAVDGSEFSDSLSNKIIYNYQDESNHFILYEVD